MTGSAAARADAPDPTEARLFPCSSSQRRCWFIDALRPGTPILNIALRWELVGRFSPSVIEAAFQSVIDRHEVLRTRFFEKDGEPVQEVSPHLAFKLMQIDLSIVPEAARAEEALALARREATIPFSLDRLPLIRVTLVRTAPDRAFLLVTIHQIAFDGASIALLAHEVGTIAEALEARREPDLPDLPLQYGDYALWQQAYFASRGFEAEIGYWRRRLEGVPYLEIPSDFPRPSVTSAKGDIIARVLSPEAGRAFEDRAKTHRTSLFGFALAGTAAALHRFTGATDLAIGTQIVSRDHPDLEPLIGVFLNNLVLRVDASGDPAFADLVQRTHGTVQDALIHQQMPFDRLVETLNPPRDPTRTPLISINFTVLPTVLRENRFGAFDLRGHPSLSPGSLYDFNFFVVRWPSGWRLALEFNPLLFERETAELILSTWCDVMERAIAGESFRLSTLPAVARAPIAARRDRAELDDLEAALGRHPLVAEAVVVERPGPEGATTSAYVVPQPGCRVGLESLPGLILADLAEDATLRRRPDGVSVLMALPRTATGAVNTRALPIPSPADIRGEPSRDAPTAVETALRGIWEDVLGVADIRPGASFFELGGHSLLAVRMVLRVKKQLGRQVDVVALFEHPTLRAFARYVDGLQAETRDGQIVAIQPRGTKTPVIAINHMLAYRDLSLRIGAERPFFSVQVLDATAAPPDDRATFEEMAAEYVRLIRRVRPRGPYILFGLCVHGVLAYEIAQQLQNAGDEVELLALVSCWHPTYPARMTHRQRWSLRLRHVRDSFGLVLQGRKSLASFLGHYSAVRRTGLLQAAVALRLIPAMPPRTGSATADAFLLYLMAARDRYRPKPYGGRVFQIVGTDAPIGPGFDPALGWTGTLTGPLAVQGAGRPWEAAVDDPDLLELGRHIHAVLDEAPEAERPLR